jgi:mono/diheme cytochrome c family protein
MARMQMLPKVPTLPNLDRWLLVVPLLAAGLSLVAWQSATAESASNGSVSTESVSTVPTGTVLASTASTGPASTGPVPAGRQIDFGRDIQPILARRCFACHGPDKGEAGLRLNGRDAALAALDSGAHAIVPGKPEESELLARVASTDDDQRMPPGDLKPLTPEQVALLRQWIVQGAEWRGHWSFEPVAVRSPPAVSDRAWPRGEIDAFILARLEREGLVPAPPAEKSALLRRACFDLTGLPPRPDEMTAFLADESPEAFAKVVDRLLESPHYGERWGRHWLDVVRYADTNSFERDSAKPNSWRYRDYVIRSLNADKPYDQFLIEQLAGDELTDAGADAIIATGFYRLGPFDDEPADREQYRYEELDDIVSTTGQALLGLTINCARCHDHKIDPLSQRDYYQMVSFFNGIRSNASNGPAIETQIFAESGSRESYDEARQAVDRQRDEIQRDIDQIEWTLLTRYREANGTVAAGEIYPADLEDLEFRFYRDTFEVLPDFGSVKPETVGKLPDHLFDLSPATRETAFGFAFRGKLVVRVEGDYTFRLDSDDGSRLRIYTNASAPREKVELAYTGIHALGDERKATFHLAAGRYPIQLEYFQREGGFGLRLDWSGPDFERRPLTKNADRPARPIDLATLVASEGPRLMGQAEVDRHAELIRKLAALKASLPTEFALSVTEAGPVPQETFVLERGNVHARGAKVEPAFPGILARQPVVIAPPPPSATTCGRRLALAHWIASPTNPLTARVMANRVWQHHFGRGIVRSPNNFGALGNPPTHPELLDWLASRLVEGGWRLKPLHRLIMLSSAYQMSSHIAERAAAVDPANDLFSHFDMRRLGAEELRDSVLSITGQLNPQMYGPGIYPEISAEVLHGQSQPGAGWGKSTPEQQARRSVYIHVKRSLILPLLSSFDFPESDSSCEARFTTSPPTQALGMLNGKFLGDEAAHFAARLAREAGDDPAARVALAYRLAFSRSPTTDETARGIRLIESLETKHQLAADAAWKYYCLTILNRNELLYLD